MYHSPGSFNLFNSPIFPHFLSDAIHTEANDCMDQASEGKETTFWMLFIPVSYYPCHMGLGHSAGG
jgi:hypothetical protein